MNILFLTVARTADISSRGIYSDLMREFTKRGIKVYIASPTERRFGKSTHIVKGYNFEILKVKTLNIQKTNIIEKGIGTLLLEWQFDHAIKKYWGNINFDLVLYSTPPITFNKVIANIKNRCGCSSYLMLKDIFPQNAVDLGMMRGNGILYNIFKKKEQRLYEISDTIGCMSPANCDYLIKHNPGLEKNKVELCPNAVMKEDIETLPGISRDKILSEFNIPTDKRIFIYGGNLGKPQGIDFLLHVIEANEKEKDSFIVVVGSGTEYPKIANWFSKYSPKNALLLSSLPKKEYDNLIRACDIGLIFLDKRFTIPNFPSRLLSYLENKMPVLLATDTSTDIGKIAEKERFGLWCESGDLNSFMANMNKLSQDVNLVKKMGQIGYEYLLNNYTVDKVVNKILEH